MPVPRSLARAEDLALGQGVIIAARWLLVASGLVLAIIEPPDANTLRIQVVLVLGLAVCNFALQAQISRRPRALTALAYAASAADIAIITVLVATNGGYSSGLYVFYFPAILALSVAFPWALTVIYSTVVLSATLAIAGFTMPEGSERDLLIRCLALAAVAMCGAVYANIERRRRRLLIETMEVQHAAAG